MLFFPFKIQVFVDNLSYSLDTVLRYLQERAVVDAQGYRGVELLFRSLMLYESLAQSLEGVSTSHS